jgi:hypothetical protein
MKDIHEVLRRKQAQYAQLAKQIEALQAAADKLREVAPLLSEAEDEGSPLVLDDGGEEPRATSAKAAAATASGQPAAKAPGRTSTPRWP